MCNVKYGSVLLALVSNMYAASAFKVLCVKSAAFVIGFAPFGFYAAALAGSKHTQPTTITTVTTDTEIRMVTTTTTTPVIARPELKSVTCPCKKFTSYYKASNIRCPSCGSSILRPHINNH
jgi:hypothetical protein